MFGPVTDKAVRQFQRDSDLDDDGRGDFAPDTNPVLAVDGTFGPITEGAVKGTQPFNHSDADGVVGMQTCAVPIPAAGR